MAITSTPLAYFLRRPLVVEALRGVRDRAESYLERGRELTPNGTDIPVGGAHIDDLARGWGLIKLLNSLGRGRSLKESLEDGKEEATLWFKNWNESRKGEYQVHRWVQSADDTLEWGYRTIKIEILKAIIHNT